MEQAISYKDEHITRFEKKKHKISLADLQSLVLTALMGMIPDLTLGKRKIIDSKVRWEKREYVSSLEGI